MLLHYCFKRIKTIQESIWWFHVQPTPYKDVTAFNECGDFLMQIYMHACTQIGRRKKKEKKNRLPFPWHCGSVISGFILLSLRTVLLFDFLWPLRELSTSANSTVPEAHWKNENDFWICIVHASKESLFNPEQWQSNHWRCEVPLSTPNGWLPKALTKPLWPFNTEGSLSRAGVGIYASCFVVFSWFGFIFFFFRGEVLGLYRPMMQVLHHQNKCRVYGNEQKRMNLKILTKLRDKSLEWEIPIKIWKIWQILQK